MSEASPILVTGAHRSGTTWVGRMLSLSPAVGYVEEPFSLRHRRGICDVIFPYWFMYVTPENEAPYVQPIKDMLAFRYRPGSELRTLHTPKDAARMVRDWWTVAAKRRRGLRPLVKDPIALFSAPWLADRFDADVVVTIRHPAGFVSSLMRLGWTHPFDHFLKQPLLMRDVLDPYQDRIRAFASGQQPVLEQGVLLWNLIHHVIRGYRESRPDWAFVRHEDMSTDPAEGFRRLYDHVGLSFDEVTRGSILRHSDPSRPAEAANPFDVRRDSRGSAGLWRGRLTQDQVERVRAGVEPLVRDFYSDEEW
jgi:hypothetical protein